MARGMTCLVCGPMWEFRLCNWPDGGVASVECSEIVAWLEITDISPMGYVVCCLFFLPPKSHEAMPYRQLYSQIPSLDGKAWQDRCWSSTSNLYLQRTEKVANTNPLITVGLMRLTLASVQVTRLKMFTARKQELFNCFFPVSEMLTTAVLLCPVVVPCLFVTKGTSAEKQVTNTPQGST